MHRILAGVAAVLLSLTLTAAPARAGAAEAAVALAESVTDAGLAGGVVVIRHGDTVIQHAAGYSDVDTRAGFGPNTHVRAASITKTFVAATVLQLVAEGKIVLDAPIETYLPGRIRGTDIDPNAITVRQLLRHQSGLPEYFDEETPLPAEPVTAGQLLDAALAKPAQFAPGTATKYTNTNYVIAGLMIEAVTGRPAADEITRRIIIPLGLVETYFPAMGDTGLRTPFARGYEVVDGRRTDVTAFNASAAGMAGSLISTSEDMSAFITALLDGRVVGPPQLDQMKDTVPWPENGQEYSYGLGLASFTLPCGVTVWGHGGGIDGYHTLMVKQPGGPAVSVTFTQSPPADAAEDPLNALVDALYCS